MGYYSDYTLHTSNKFNASNTTDYNTIYQALKNKSGYYDDFLEESIKWYTWREDALEVSAANPEIKFGIERAGESNGDHEYSVYYGGVCVLNDVMNEFKTTPLNEVKTGVTQNASTQN